MCYRKYEEGFNVIALWLIGSHCLEKGMATHSSTLAWKIPWTEEPGGLQSMGSQRLRHDGATSLSLFTCMHWRRKWQPPPVFLPGESQGRGSLSMGSHRVRHNWSDAAAAVAAYKQKAHACPIYCHCLSQIVVLFFVSNFFDIYLIYNVVLVLIVQQSNSYIYIYVLFQIFFPYRLLHHAILKNVEYSSLCYTVVHCQLPILYIEMCIR